MVSESSESWKSVVANVERLKSSSLRDLFNQDKNRASRFTKTLGDGESEIVVDFSKQLIDEKLLHDLLALAKREEVVERFTQMRSGAKANFTENNPALHTALRAAQSTSVLVDGENVVSQVHSELARMKVFVEKIRRENKYKKIVSIGIGGSDLGPALIYEALRGAQTPKIECAFVANIDSTEINLVLSQCEPQETLFVVCSKSFTTAETLANARIAADWLAGKLGVKPDSSQVAEQFVVVSAHVEKAKQVGVVAANSFQIWPWVGGRYSIASAMSLAPIIAFGFDAFADFLAGMRSVDDQMQNTEIEQNTTLILGLIDVMNFGTRRFTSQAVLPYASALRLLPSYLQQLIMESNGKSMRSDGGLTEIATSPVIWGGVGTNSQHAFMQMLHQGTQVVPVEFIGFAQLENVNSNSHDALVANMFAQSRALAFGRKQNEIAKSAHSLHQIMTGNRPSTTLLAKRLSARTLGALVAMYEHRVFVHGVVAQINSFDQWGVELGKVMSTEISKNFTTHGNTKNQADEFSSDSEYDDSSTRNLIDWYRKSRKHG